MTLSYTNRKGKTYFLHARKRGTKTRYVFARTEGEGALDALPPGFEIRESVHGQVSVAKARPRLITEAEEEIVRAHMPSRCKLEIAGEVITVFEPQGRLGAAPDWLPEQAREVIERRLRFTPVVRLTLADAETRSFEVARWVYRGDEGWSYPIACGPLDEAARRVLPLIGTDAIFRLY